MGARRVMVYQALKNDEPKSSTVKAYERLAGQFFIYSVRIGALKIPYFVDYFY